MDIFYVILTSVFSFIALFFILKIIGNRQMSELNMFDYLNGITIGSIAAEMATNIEEFEKPLVAMIVYAVLVFLLSKLTEKFLPLRRFFSGRTLVLFNNGKFLRKNMSLAKIDLSEMLSQMRISGYFNPDDVKTVILEPNGKLSVLPKSVNHPLTASDVNISLPDESICVNVIMEGWIMTQNLKSAGFDEKWLESELSRLGIGNVSDVFLGFITPDGNLSAYKFEDKSSKNDLFQ